MTEMTREQHIIWCKKRAIAEMDYHKDPKQGVISMMSDLRKHPETDKEVLISLCMLTLMTPILSRQKAVEFINGFN